MRVIARCVHGLEWVCADEVSHRLGVGDLSLGRRELAWSAGSLTPALAELATVDDVFAEVGRFGGTGTTKAALPAIGDELVRLPWSAVRSAVGALREVPDRPVIDVVASLEGRRSYTRFAVEQVAGELLSSHLGGTYLRRTAEGREPGDPDLTVRLFLRADQVIAAIRVGREPAHRRAWKLSTGPGTLHPPAAAALARLALSGLALSGAGHDHRVRPEPSAPSASSGAPAVIMDPFCGDGTIAIETARLAPELQVLGQDADPSRVANAQHNASRAGVTAQFAVADAGSAHTEADRHRGGRSDGRAGLVITNPPWNLAVDATGVLAGSLEAFWGRLPSLLTASGRVVLLADDALGAPNALRGHGFGLSVVQPVRLSGRIAQVIVATPSGAPAPALSDDLLRWKVTAEAAGATFA